MTDTSNPAFIPLFRTLSTAGVKHFTNPTIIIYGIYVVLNKTQKWYSADLDFIPMFLY